MNGDGYCPIMSKLVEYDGRKGSEYYLEKVKCLEDECEIWVPEKRYIETGPIAAHCGLARGAACQHTGGER